MQVKLIHSEIARPTILPYASCMGLELRIREIRQAKGMTLAELAEMVGVSVPHISGVERGVKNLNNHLIVRISAALGVSPLELLKADPNIERALSIMPDLSDEDQLRVLDFALALRESNKQAG